MATSSNRDVRLGVEIQAAGEENLKRLAAEVRALARAGGEAAPEYVKLADELDRVATQARALDAFKTASKSIEQTTAAAAAAAAEATRLREAFNAQQQAADSARAAQTRLRDELDATKKAVAGQVLQVELLKQSLKDGTVSQEQYGASLSELNTSLANNRARVAELGVDYRRAREEASAASAELNKLAGQSLRASENADKLNSTVREQSEAMDAARAAGQRLGVDFTELAVAQNQLNQALTRGTDAVQAAAAAAREQAEADALARVQIEGKAEAQRRAAIAAQSELAAIKESEAFTRQYIATQAAARQAAAREQAEADRLAAQEIAGRAEAQRQGAIAARAELEAIRDSEQFLKRYAAAQDEARAASRAAALAYVEAEEAAAAAADKAARRAAELNAQAERTKRGEQYVRELAAAFDAAEQQAAEAAAQVAKLQGYFDKLAQERDVIGQAFGTTGVRSIQAIELEMFKVQRALVTLRTEFAEGRISVADFDRAVASANVRLQQLKTEIATIPGDRSVFDQLAAGANNLITKFGALTAALAAVGFAFKPVIDSVVKLEAATRILTSVTGSAAEAARQIEFLRNVSQRAGVSFDESAQTYAKFAASALQAGVSVKDAQAAFQAVAMAAGNMGLSSDQARRALEALSQMASKGTVSMEELRQQLGDALPGVLPLLAKQLGLTDQELNKLVESGGLLARDAIPAIAEAVKKLGPASGEVDGLAAAWNRFKNVVMEAGTTLAEGPIGKAAGYLAGAFAGALRDVAVVAVGASEALTVVGRTLALVGAAATGNISSFRQFGQEFDKILLDSGAKLAQFKDRAYASGEAVTSTGQAAATAAPQVAQAGQAADAAAAQHQALGQAAAGAATGVQQTAAAASGARTQLLRLAADYAANVDAAEQMAKVAVKNAQARKAEAEAIRDAAALTGNETVIKEAAVRAATMQADALRAEAEAQQTVVNVLTARRNAVEQQALAEGRLDAERKKQLATWDQAIEKERADADAKRQAADAAEAQALAAELASEKLKDNAARQDELRVAVTQAAAAVERARVGMVEGTVTAGEYRNAVRDLTRAQVLLADAVDDARRRTEFAAQARVAVNRVESEGLRLKLEESKARQAAAERTSDETTKLREQVTQKQIEIQIAEREVAVQRQNAEGRIESIRQQRNELAARGELTVEKERDLELQTLEQEAILRNAKTREATIKALKEEKKAREDLAYQKLLESDPSRLVSGNGLGGITNNQAARNAQVKSTITGAQYDAQGFALNTDGSRVTGTVFTPPPDDTGDYEWIPMLNQNAAGGEWRLSAAGAARRAAARRTAVEQAYTATGQALPARGVGTAGTPNNAAVVRWLLANGYTATGEPASGPRSETLRAAAGSTSDATAPTAAPVVTTGTRTLRLEIAGIGGTDITLASPADAARLEAWLRQLEQAAGRAAAGGGG